MTEYEKYSGDFEKDDVLNKLKIYHRSVKKYYIAKYSKNKDLLIDIGSGRGADIETWILNNINMVVGIEPSVDSIKESIKRYKNFMNKYRNKKITKISFLNGVGDKNWNNGSAALRNEDVNRFIDLFDKKRIQADNINMCWTIHYMLDNKEDFKNLLINIKNHLKINGTIVILTMDGDMIHEILKKNNGIYEIKKDTDVVFSLESLYDLDKDVEKEHYNNKITVNMKATYGLEKGIGENLVFSDFLIKSFVRNGFELLEKTKFLDLPIDYKEKLFDYEKKISSLYLGFVFKKIE